MSVRIKICGITTPADAELAASLGVDMIGLNFYPKSPRCIDEATARSIVHVLPATCEAVALFVDESPARALKRARDLGISIVQLHGEHREPLVDGVKWIHAFPVRDRQSVDSIESHVRAAAPLPFAILVDAHVPGMHGGTGQTAPWQLLADFKPGVPLILAGGLTPENVAEAIRIVRPYAVDVASGVESSPGRKDADKLRRFVEAVRAYVAVHSPKQAK
jgi:phosphoribosylanthranilate isomerase